MNFSYRLLSRSLSRSFCWPLGLAILCLSACAPKSPIAVFVLPSSDIADSEITQENQPGPTTVCDGQGVYVKKIQNKLLIALPDEALPSVVVITDGREMTDQEVEQLLKSRFTQSPMRMVRPKPRHFKKGRRRCGPDWCL